MKTVITLLGLIAIFFNTQFNMNDLNKTTREWVKPKPGTYDLDFLGREISELSKNYNDTIWMLFYSYLVILILSTIVVICFIFIHKPTKEWLINKLEIKVLIWIVNHFPWLSNYKFLIVCLSLIWLDMIFISYLCQELSASSKLLPEDLVGLTIQVETIVSKTPK